MLVPIIIICFKSVFQSSYIDINTHDGTLTYMDVALRLRAGITINHFFPLLQLLLIEVILSVHEPEIKHAIKDEC